VALLGQVAQLIYSVSSCFIGIGGLPSRLSQPAKGRSPCRSLISNGIYRFGPSSKQVHPSPWVSAPASCRSRRRVSRPIRPWRSVWTAGFSRDFNDRQRSGASLPVTACAPPLGACFAW